MKTLKKTLSLVLALVMVLGLVGVGAYAAPINAIDDYKDVDDIKYVEAVDVMSGIGILAGYAEDGNFKPETHVTREQAAKIVTYMLIGATAADALQATSDPFDDVSKDRWSAGYIAYCADNGIIDGYGDGTFGPAAYVTNYEFAKLMLCAVGYGANDEYVGSSWSLNVAKDAIPLGVFRNNTAGANNNPATRDEAALYAFNTLTSIYKVSYSTLLGTYAIGGSNAITGTITGETLGESVYKLYRNGNAIRYAGYFTYEGGDPITYGASDGFTGKKYNIEKVAIKDCPEDMGRNAYVWYVIEAGKKLAVSNYYFDDEALGFTTDGTKTVDATNPKKPAYIADLDEEYDVYVNDSWVADENYVVVDNATAYAKRGGVPIAAGDYYIYSGDLNLYTAKIAKANPVKDGAEVDTDVDGCLNGNGVKVEYVDTDDNGQIDAIYYTIYTAAKVSVKGSDSVTFLLGVTSDALNFTDGSTLKTKWDAEDVIGFDDIAKSDVITAVNINGKLYVTVADTDEGKIKQVNSTSKSCVINDTTYKTAKFPYSAAAVSTVDKLVLGNELTIYIDQYGYIINTGDVTVNLNSVYYVSGNNAGQGIGGVSAKIYGVDGKSQIVTVEKFYNYATSALVNVDAGTPGSNALAGFAFIGNEDGTWTLNRLANSTRLEPKTVAGVNSDIEYKVSKDTTAITTAGANATNVAGKFANDDTIFVDVENGRTYTGYKALPKSLTFTSGAFATSQANPNLLTVVFMGGEIGGGDISKFMVYKADEFIATENSKGETEYTWTVFVDGTLKTDFVVNSTVHAQIRAAGQGVYTIKSANGSGVVTALDAPVPAASFPADMNMATYNSGSVLTAGGKTWSVTDDTIFIRIYDTSTAAPKAELSEQGAVAGDATNGSTVYVEAKGATGADANTAKIVYIWVA